MELPDYVDVDFCLKNEVSLKVYLDGVEQDYVTEAHVKEGWITRLKENGDGSLNIEGGSTVDERLSGQVSVVVG